jgi:hypothetical protein
MELAQIAYRNLVRATHTPEEQRAHNADVATCPAKDCPNKQEAPAQPE